jgi:hypothetical protein
MNKKKYPKAQLDAVLEGVLVESLQLWQNAFIQELDKMKADGKIPMFHPNWTAQMLREFGHRFRVQELIDTPAVQD